jgi:hypothetical protein
MCLKKKKNYSDAILNVIRKNNALTYITNGFNKINKTIKSVTSPLHLTGIDNYIQIYETVANSKINSIGDEDTRDWLQEVLVRRLNALEKLQDKIITDMATYAKIGTERINKEIEHENHWRENNKKNEK